MKSDQKFWLLGFVGCALFGIGDWLLGYVDPQPVSEAFSNGIDTFCMNAGMMIWFGYLLMRMTGSGRRCFTPTGRENGSSC